MADRTTEGSPTKSVGSETGTVPPATGLTDWEQLALINNPHVVLRPQLVIDGTCGQMAVSVSVLDFWSGDQMACEVRPAMRFPQDVDLALLWIEERVRHYSALVPPF